MISSSFFEKCHQANAPKSVSDILNFAQNVKNVHFSYEWISVIQGPLLWQRAQTGNTSGCCTELPDSKMSANTTTRHWFHEKVEFSSKNCKLFSFTWNRTRLLKNWTKVIFRNCIWFVANTKFIARIGGFWN